MEMGLIMIDIKTAITLLCHVLLNSNFHYFYSGTILGGLQVLMQKF